jgi:uncharacterized cupredoxin-like copper-binding protein
MRRKVALAVVLAAVIVAPACSSSTPSTTSSSTPTTGGNVVKVSEKEFTITATSGSFTSLTAGNITFEVKNDGTINHEFVIVKTDLAADKLPVKDSKVDEDSSKLTPVDEIEEFAPGKTESKAFDLTAGSYVAFCNVVGHYGSGMHTAITVV